MKRQKLSKKNIETLENGIYQDEEFPQLLLYVRPKNRSFVYSRKVNYKQYKKKVGNAETMSRAEAIQICTEWSANIGRFGAIEPENNTTKKIVKDLTLKEAYQAYAAQRPENSKGCAWNAHCQSIENKTISSISREELIEMHKGISKNTPISANRTIGAIRTVINFAIKEGMWNGVNEATRIRFNRENSRNRFLTPEEAPRVIAELVKMRHEMIYRNGADALLLMLYTWQRGGNVLAMEWSEIDSLNLWTIPSFKAKARKDIVVALTEDALKIINERRNNGSRYVFPMRNNPDRHYMECKKVWQAVCKRCGLENCHKHDLRHTGATYALRSGADITTVSAALGHASVSFTAKVYAHVMTESKLEAAYGAINAMKNGGKKTK